MLARDSPRFRNNNFSLLTCYFSKLFTQSQTSLNPAFLLLAWFNDVTIKSNTLMVRLGLFNTDDEHSISIIESSVYSSSILPLISSSNCSSSEFLIHFQTRALLIWFQYFWNRIVTASNIMFDFFFSFRKKKTKSHCQSFRYWQFNSHSISKISNLK